MSDVNNNVNDSQNIENGGTSDQTGNDVTTGTNNSNSTVDNGTQTTDNQGGQKQERTFTQEEVNRMMAKEKHQGKKSVYNELGIDPEDTSAIDKFKAFMEAQKTDKEKSAEKEAKAKQELMDMSVKLKKAETKAALMQAGISSDFVDDAVIITLSKLDTDESLDVEDVVKELKSKYSVWFGDSGKETNKNKGTGKRGTGKPANVGNSNQSGNGTSGIGKRLAATRVSQKPSNSFWND